MRHLPVAFCVALTIISMASVNLVVVTEAARTLITHKGNDLNDFHLPSVIAVSVALGVKILLFLYCFTIRQHSSQVQVLWEDHRNDLFVNGFGASVCTMPLGS